MPGRICMEGSGAVLAADVRWALSARQRARGLLGRPPLRSGEALVIPRTRQVHTFGMGYPIDVVFCAADRTVLRVYSELRPWRMTAIVWRAATAIELPSGAAEAVSPGMRIDFQC